MVLLFSLTNWCVFFLFLIFIQKYTLLLIYITYNTTITDIYYILTLQTNFIVKNQYYLQQKHYLRQLFYLPHLHYTMNSK